MRLKSFTGKTLAEAMAQVRAALGDDAIIIATRDDEGPNGTVVQVTAALDDRPTTAAPTDDILPSLSSALIEDDALDSIADALQRHGTPVMVAEAIVAHTARHFNGDAGAALAAGLGGVLSFGESPEKTAKTILLIGPPGAGKTAMIGKLAARAALAGKQCVAISTDLERAGGVAQLAAYTQSLRMPLMEVEDARALRDAMDMHTGADIILVDSTGINPFDAKAAALTQKIVREANATTVLVLPAGLEPMDAAELTNAFKNLGATYLLPTRLDLARRLGSLLAIAAESKLMLCAASASPSIAAGLEILTPQSMAARLLPQTATHTQTTTASPHGPQTATHGKR
jgi:flagellar biosynthesis protein FlhF